MNCFNAGNYRRWVSGRRLYKVILLSCLMGTILPVLTIPSKLSANNFKYWEEFKTSKPLLAHYVSEYPILDISRTMPFLSNLSWHHSWDHRIFPQYSVPNACILILLLLFRRRVFSGLEQVVEWLYVDEHGFARWVVFSVVFVLLVTYQSKTTLGFWDPGVGGWTYANWRPQIATHLPESSVEDRVQLERASFLETALVPEHATYLTQKGYLTGKAMFLHYRNGEVLPANYELTELVFPEYVFSERFQELSRPDVFFHIIKASLANRNADRRFLLPLSIAYPNHSVYMKIDYEKYPLAEYLEKISFWELTVFVDDRRQVHIVRASNGFEIDAQ